MNRSSILFLCFCSLLFIGCSVQKINTDLLVFNSTIYTVDSSFSVHEAMAVDKGKVIAIGKSSDLIKLYKPSRKINASGQFIYPGFIDAHAHFLSYGLGLQSADLVGTTSWQQILQRLQTYAAKYPDGWLIGRGWDQNDWTNKDFPDRQALDSLFPTRPVLLTRVDGHAAIVNQTALEAGNVTLNTNQNLTGGKVEVENGRLTGILIDNAIDLVSEKIPQPTEIQKQQALKDAQANCFAVGLTTVDDCGLNASTVDLARKMHESGELKMRLYIMLSDQPANYQYLLKSGIIKTDRLHVRAFKVYADGALGSRGACLLQPYSDRPGQYGFLLSPVKHFSDVAELIHKNGFQMCTHAIGDSGNRVVLEIYNKLIKKQDDRRWRIEHAQVVAPSDFHLFGRSGTIPSVQPTHATSDMYWAEERLGTERVKGAYAFKELLKQNGWIALGTDFPVEDINPLNTFFAAVVRKDAKGWPANGFQVENALTREEALRGMTIWAARSNFEEKEKGSLEKNKLADFIITDQDLMRIPDHKILSVKIVRTFINGEQVFEKK